MVEWILCIGGKVNDEIISFLKLKYSKTSVVDVADATKQHTTHPHTSHWFALVAAESDMV